MKSTRIAVALVMMLACCLAVSAAIPAAERQALIDLYNSTNGASWTQKTNWLGAAGTENTWFGVTTDAGNTTVVDLDLSHNNLVGTLPASLGNLANLQFLNFDTNQLSGSIPPQLGNLSNLYSLNLSRNQLTGSIPPELGNMSSLSELGLITNQLTGSIPAALGNLSNLREVNFAYNQLSGSIPPQLGNLSNLELLYFHSNQLTGSIPPELGSLSKLRDFWLHSNQLTGSIPTQFGTLSDLVGLWLSSNQLTGSIPTELGNLGDLQVLSLSSNRLTGTIPSSLGNLSGLQDLYLQSNQLTGSIPASLTNLTQLAFLNISWNALHTSDAALLTFLNSKQPTWAATQTIAPTNVAAVPSSATSVNLTWDPIPYTAGTGGYRVSKSATQGGPYTFHAQTANKSAASQLVTGLTTGIPVYFVVQTRTDAHPNNLNVVDSENSAEVAAAPGVPATIAVTAPNGGENWASGSVHNITWTSINVGHVKLEYSTNGGSSYSTIVASTANTGTYPWTIPNTPSTNCLVKASDASNAAIFDTSNTSFTITAPAIVKDNLLGTWDGQGVYCRNSDSGLWTILATAADLIACGDLGGDGVDDLFGIWSGQAGVWKRDSAAGVWTFLGSSARHIGAGDMNGDGRVDFLGTWDGQGVYSKDSISGVWTLLATPADLITAGDLDGDGEADLIGIWAGQAGVWVKSSLSGTWSFLGSSARDMTTGDMNGDGRADLVGTWDGQGVYYKDSISGVWTQMATPADQIAAGDLDGDGKDDLIGIWAGQAGVWVKYSQTQTWTFIGSSARDIGAGKFVGGAWTANLVKISELDAPMGGIIDGPPAAPSKEISDAAPGGRFFNYQIEGDLTPKESGKLSSRIPGPGEPGFDCARQENLLPGQGKNGQRKERH